MKSFPTVQSHYCRKDTRQYLEENLNVTKMYDLYVQKCNKKWKVNPEKLSFYRHIFNTEFNFHQPTKDACMFWECYNTSEHKNSPHTKQFLLILSKC